MRNIEMEFRKRLKELIKDPKVLEEVFKLYEWTEFIKKEERRALQMKGIKQARENGRPLGRPRLKEPENFSVVVDAWLGKKMSAATAAQMCGMKMSTFYRRVREVKNKE